MAFVAASPCFKSGLSKVLKSFTGKARIGLSNRCVYTFSGKTGIPGFDKNRKAFEEEYKDKYLPSWLENCPLITQGEMDALYSAFPAFADDLETLECAVGDHLKPGNTRVRQFAEHTVPWAPYTAAQMLIANRFYMDREAKMNRPIADLEVHMKKIHKVAWCMESMARYEFQMDDEIDNAEARNGLESWTKKPEIGLEGLYDMSSALTGGYLLLHKYCSHEDYFLEMSKFIMEMLHVTQVGPISLSMLKPTPRLLWSNGDLEMKGMEEFVLCKRETNAALLLHSSVILPMIMNGVKDPELRLRELVLKMGKKVCDCIILIDDLIDYEEKIEVSQRQGSDIRLGRQTWLLWKAMELGNEDQCNRLQEYYGRDDVKCENEVKKVFEELQIVSLLKELAKDNYKTLRREIDEMPQEDVPCCIFTYILDHYIACINGKAARL